MCNSTFRAVLALILCSSLVMGTVLAKEITIADPTCLSLIDTALPGDVITLKDGNWNDALIQIKKGGTEKVPVLIKAETPGGVILGGSSSLMIEAPYVTVDGLLFLNGAITKGSVIWFKSNHGIVQNTAIIDYNPADFKTGYRWVVFSGENNLIDRCYFKGKNNANPVVNNDDGDSRSNSVIRSYFKDIPLKAKVNGREILRIWGAGHADASSTDGSYFTIADNLLEHADGEGAEIISLKSNYNKVLRNTIITSVGCLNIRRGNFNEVKDNVILGQGIKGALGIRMSGENNLVEGNLVSGCEYGIQVSSGEHWADAITPAYVINQNPNNAKLGVANKARYPQNKYVTIVSNMMVGISGPDLNLGGGYKKRWPEQQNILIPEECLIKNNTFVRPKGGTSVIGTTPDTNPPLDRFSFKPNIYIENLLYGGKNRFDASAGGFKEEAIPTDWSEEKATAGFKPLTPADVGPDWVREKGL